MKANLTRKKRDGSSSSFMKQTTLGVGLCLLTIAALYFPALAADDDVPFFAGANGAPNIMFIFDNSDSMQDIPNLRANGFPVRPGTDPASTNNATTQNWMWRQGVKLNADGTVMVDSNGKVVPDYNAFPSSTEMPIPEQSPALLPHTDSALDSLTSNADTNDTATPKVLPVQTPLNLPPVNTTLTGTVSNTVPPLAATLTSNDIYDTALGAGWTTAGTVLADTGLFNANYRYRLVEVRPADLSEPSQFRTILSRNTGGKFFSIDPASGGSLKYTAGKTYTYTILADNPAGRVTRRVDTTSVTDANIDWNSTDAAWTNSANWVGKMVRVTAGTNVGQERAITGRDLTNKKWNVAAFPVACDYTSYYQIVDPPSNTSRIYDTSLDWTTATNSLVDTTKFNENYRYRTVQITSAAGNTQERTILSRDVANKFFTVDVTAAAGGPIEYLTEERPYTYTIMTDGPGRVTRVGTSTSRVSDADIKWSTIETEYNAKWKDRTLVITAGANKDLKRKITGINKDEKYWQLESAFPVACDINTRYTIIGVPDDNRYAFGGNHPGSKLYQAKQAMNYFLTNASLKVCIEKNTDDSCAVERYAINMGFATYLSARVPRVTAKYYRKRPGNPAVPASGGVYVDPPGYTYDPPAVPAHACAYYKGYSSAYTEFRTAASNTSFTASGWKTAPTGTTSWTSNQVFTGVSVGTTFDRLYREGSCDQQVIKYKVTNIVHDPTDTLPNQYKFVVESRTSQASEGGHWWSSQQCRNVASCAALPATISGMTLIPSSTCYPCNFYALVDDPPYWNDPAPYTTPIVPATPATPDWYEVTYRDTYGNYSITNPSAPDITASTPPQYVDRDTHLVIPYAGFSGSGSTPKASPDPNVPTSDYTLVTTTITGVNFNAAGTSSGNIEPNTFDTSYFMYPPLNTEERPHGWSYKKTSEDWIHGTSGVWQNILNQTAEYPKARNSWNSQAKFPWPGMPTASLVNGTWSLSTWKDSDQNSIAVPNFPALVGDEMGNFKEDDQVVFVNLPQYDGSSASFGDDIGGLNIDKILEYTKLTRIKNPDNSSSWTQSFDYTIMPYSKSIPPNVYSALQGSGTPIAASLKNLKTYYTEYIKKDSLTLGGCRKNYVIFLTDGLETGGGDPVQAAQELLNLTIDGEKYEIKTFVIGFGLDAASKETLNNIAVAGGTEHAYFADNVETLVDILVDEITSSILDNNYSRSTPLVSKYIPGQDLNLYMARFDYPSWRGHLYANEVDSQSGRVGGIVPGWSSDCDANTYPDGDAGCELATYGHNKVYTGYFNASSKLTRMTLYPGTLSSGDLDILNPLVNPNDLDIDGIGGPDTNDDAQTVINYVLDSGYDGGKYSGGRDTDWPLGDIYHSGPLRVGPPSAAIPALPSTGFNPFKGYDEYKAIDEVKDRETIIYAGANDGMLHAFGADNGRQRWAYIPNGVLGKLYEFKEGHRFTVDLPLKSSDIYSPSGKNDIWSLFAAGDEKFGWHTVLTSGLRGGGTSYYALDITDPADPLPLWEVTDVDTDISTRDMGKTWSTPSFGMLLIDGVTTHVIFVGGGLSSQENTGNNVYIIDAATGAILKEIPVGSSSNHVPAQLLTLFDTDKTSPYFGYTVDVYIADTSGDLWKIQGLNDDAAALPVWDPTVQLIHDGVGKVFHRPTFVKNKGGCIVTVDGVDYKINTNTNFIFYGTGDEESPTDLLSTDRLYEIADPPLSAVDLVSPSLSKVWEIPLTGSQKMLNDPLAYLGVFYLTTYSPEGGCAQGTSFLWGVTSTKCGRAGGGAGIVFDIVGEELTTKTTTLSLGVGITSAPTATGFGLVIQASGNNTLADASMAAEVGHDVAVGIGDDDDDDDDDDDEEEDKKKRFDVKTLKVDRIEYWRELFQ